MSANRTTGCGRTEGLHQRARKQRRLVLGALLLFLGLCGPKAGLSAQGPPNAGRAVELEGDLDVLFEDSSAGGRLLYFLETVTGRFPIRFPGRGPDLRSGTRVRVAGNLADGVVTTTSVSTLAASTSRTLGEQSVLVVLMNFSNNPTQPYTATSIDNVNAEVRSFYQENSYQQTTMTFTVTGWHTIAATNATCDYNTWANQADVLATNAGFALSAYDRRLYAFPYASACGWWGMGNAGGPRSWINGTYATRVVAHEQGHNFGNMHSHAMKCDSTGCLTVDYGDDRDVLGAGGVVGHMNAFQKERLGWLNYGGSPTIQTVTSTGDYWIENYETVGSGSKGLRIWNAATGKYYYVEVRSRAGFGATVLPGVTLHTGSPSDSNSSYQVDLAPASSEWDSTLDVGQTFTDAALGLSITSLSSGLDGALVRVLLDGVPCVRATPSVSLTPGSPSAVSPGTTVSYILTATNNDSAGCSATAFSLSGVVPNGWTGSLDLTSVSLSPGTNTSTAFRVTSPTTVTSGTSTVTARATDAADASRVGTGSASYLVATTTAGATLSVQVSTSQTSYARNNTVTATAIVMSGSSPAVGAPVSFVFRKANGSTVTATATTDARGYATAQMRLRSKDPLGTYQVTATSGSTSASASFSVR